MLMGNVNDSQWADDTQRPSILSGPDMWIGKGGQPNVGVTAMSIWRWDRDPELIELGWPLPIRIRSRKFRSRIALENFKRVMARKAIEQRGRPSCDERQCSWPKMQTIWALRQSGQAWQELAQVEWAARQLLN